MPAKYVWHSTKHKGLRYRVHEARKCSERAVKKDRFYQYRLMIDGVRVQESFGWWSEWIKADPELRKDKSFEVDCVQKIEALKEARKTGQGPGTLRECRDEEAAKRSAAEAERKRSERDRMLFSEVWAEYLAQAQADRGMVALARERSLYQLWIQPVIGKKSLREIELGHLEKIKARMANSVPGKHRGNGSPDSEKTGLAPRTICYALAVVRQVFNYARRHGYFDGESPTTKIRKPSEDNRRLRFLTREEAEALLARIAETSQDVHHMALLSLHTGMRAGEIFSLCWQDVDLERGILTLRNTKNGRSRPAFLTDQAKGMIKARKPTAPSPTDLVFPPTGNRQKGKIQRISDTFPKAVDTLGLNKGISDPRHKITFHTLRHTYASWQVERGVDLYTVKELLGHKTLAMTSRYAHLSPSTLQAAALGLGKTLEKEAKREKIDK